jgi:hypothetical protein
MLKVKVRRNNGKMNFFISLLIISKLNKIIRKSKIYCVEGGGELRGGGTQNKERTRESHRNFVALDTAMVCLRKLEGAEGRTAE